MIMIRFLGLVVSLTAVGWSSAWACMESITSVQNYSAIDPTVTDGWHDPKLSIGLVYITEDIDGTFKSELIESLSENFKLGKSISAISATGGAARFENSMKTKPRGFSFWDRRDIAFSTTYVPDAPHSSCGPMPLPVLLPENYYVVFKIKDWAKGVEIVTGPEDPFVKDIRDTRRSLVESKINMTAESYLKNMDGFVEVELNSCPKDGFIKSRDLRNKLDADALNEAKIFASLDSYESDIAHLSFDSFYSYRSKLNTEPPSLKADSICAPGQKFLVLDKPSPSRSRGPTGEGMHFIPPPRHRFLEIENGFIKPSEIISKITLSDTQPISVTQVKKWIREGNAK